MDSRHTFATTMSSENSLRRGQNNNRGDIRGKMKHRIMSDDSCMVDDKTSTESVMNLVRQIIDNRLPSLSLQMSTQPKDMRDEQKIWRGWVVTGEMKPIALLTSDPLLKKERLSEKVQIPDNVEEDIFEKLIKTVYETEVKERQESISVLPVKNIKLKVKTYSLTDLEQFETKFHQGSGTSLFKDNLTGLRKGNTPDVLANISARYDLPNVFKEEGSQASSTQLRIFKAQTVIKQPMCSLKRKSRERLFLMFSPSDENVVDIMNNSQIKNKMLRHEIGIYLKPKKTSKAKKTEQLTNVPFYPERKLPKLVPVKEPGILKNYPPLTLEILYDNFFKETEIRKGNYTIMVKEQPLLIENITLCMIPKEHISSAQEKKKFGFGPRYTFKDRETEHVQELPIPPKEYRKVKKRHEEPKDEAISEVEPKQSDIVLVKSIVNEKLRKVPDLRDCMDERLIGLSVYLREKAELPVESKLPVEPQVVTVENKETEVEEEETIPPTAPKKIRSTWDKFERTGANVRVKKEQIVQVYNEIEEELKQIEGAIPFDPNNEDLSGTAKEDNAENLAEEQPKKELQQIEDATVEEEEEPSVVERPDIGQIMEEVKINKLRLKKEKVVPVVKPEIPQYKSSGKKRFYLTNMQQYWADYHTDTKVFHHNPLQMSGHVCKEAVINDVDRIGSIYMPKSETLEEEIITEEEEEDVTEEEVITNDGSESSIHKKHSSKEIIPPVGIEPIIDILPAPIITPQQVDEIQHELAGPKFSYSQDKTKFAGLTPSTFYKNSKKEIVALNYIQRFLKNYETLYLKRRKLFICAENELGVQKVVCTTIKPTGLPYKDLEFWPEISKFVANNVTFVPLKDPLFLPHLLSSPGSVLEKGQGDPFEMSTLLASLLIGQGYDAYVVSGYANTLLVTVESSRNYLRYDCPYLTSEGPTDPFQTFNTKSYVVKMIEKAVKIQKQSSNYHPTVAPYLDSSYLLQVKLDDEKSREEEALRISIEEEEIACSRFQSLFEADELEGKRVHSWVLVLAGKRKVENSFFIEPSSGFAYELDDTHYYGIESLWNHQNYWINKLFIPFKKEEPEEGVVEEEEVVEEVKKVYTENAEEEEERDKEEPEPKDKEEPEPKDKEEPEPKDKEEPEPKDKEEPEPKVKEEPQPEVEFNYDLADSNVWIPVFANGPQIYKEEKGKKKAEIKAKIARLQKSLDMPSSWCSKISITTNQVEMKINEPFRTSLYKRAVCHEYQVGLNDDGLIAKVTKYSDLPRTDPEFEIQAFERRKDRMFRRRRDIVSDKLTECFSFGREDCLQSHEYIDGSDAMYCDHNLFFYWDFRDDGLVSVHMTDLYLRFIYRGRKDNLTSILVLYGSSIEEKRKKKGANVPDSGKTPRKEITTIIQQFDPSPDVDPWNDVAKVVYRITKGEVIVDYQSENARVTITTKYIKKSHNDPELAKAVAEIGKKKRNKEDDEDCLSELDMENFDKTLDIEPSQSSDDEESKPSKLTTGSQSDKKLRRGGKKGSLVSVKSSRKSLREGKKVERTSEESIKSSKSTKSTKSTASEASFGFSDVECSSADEKPGEISFYPANLVADKDKSLWACSSKTTRFLGRKMLNSLFKRGMPGTKDINQTHSRSRVKMNDLSYLTKDSSPESSGEEEEYQKDLRKRQIKAISEINELYKAIERDSANPNIDSITGPGKAGKIHLCKLEDLVNHASSVANNKKSIQYMKKKLNDRLHKQSVLFPGIQITNYKIPRIENAYEVSSIGDDGEKIECYQGSEDQEGSNSLKITRKKSKLKHIAPPIGKAISLDLSDKNTPNETSTSKINISKNIRTSSIIDPLIVGIYTDTDRCLDDPFSMKKVKPFAKSEAKMKNMFNTVNEDFSANDEVKDDTKGQSLDFRKTGEGTLSEEEAANEKDIDSVEGEVYNSDDNYSLQSKNASSRECTSSDDENEEDAASKEEFSCQSENENIIEYPTEAPKHQPYDFKGFHFQAGKMYARKLYQLKEVCDNVAIDSDIQSSYDGDDDYNAEFLQGEIDKFLEHTVDRITQELREARNLIGGLKKGSETNLDQTGVYFCNLNDRYINYVDSYFKKINKKRELESDKALLMEMLKQKAKEPEKIIKHIREYVTCKKRGIEMELDENLMNLIPHVRPVEVKKKDRLGYEILDDDDDDEVEFKTTHDDGLTPKVETIRESIEPVNITTAELVERLGESPTVPLLLDAVNNLKKFKDMETVNQLINLPLHECFSDVNIRTHLQNTKVNDGYFIDATIEGNVRESENCATNLGFVTDPEHILLSKDVDVGQSSESEPEVVEPEMKLKHMEIQTDCGKETIKEADFFEPIYMKNMKFTDPFRPQKFRMFASLNPTMLDSDSDGSINKKIKTKRRKVLQPEKKEEIKEVPSERSVITTTGSTTSFLSTYAPKTDDIDRTFGLEPISKSLNLDTKGGICRVGVKNMSVNDEVSHVDKAMTLEIFLSMEDETINYVRNMESYIHNLLTTRRKERMSFKRHMLETSRKYVRRSNFKVLQEKLNEFNRMADEVSFDWDLLIPYLHLLLPQDTKEKFTPETSKYILRLLIIDFIERELYKLKGLYYTYEKARQNVIEKKNLYISNLENMSFLNKGDFEKAVNNFNELLRRTADQAHVVRFVILRRAKQATKRFLKLIEDIKQDERIHEAYSEAKERLILIDLSKRWPEYFEFILNFSGLPVASEPNDFSSSYISPVDDIVLRKILKQVRKKPPKQVLSEQTYNRYLDLMEKDREYFEGLRKKGETKRKKSAQSLFFDDGIELSVDGKYSEFIDKIELVNDLEWNDFMFAGESSEEIVQPSFHTSEDISEDITKKTSFDVCAKMLVEELLLIKMVESGDRLTKEMRRHTASTILNFDEEQKKRDLKFFEKYGTPEARNQIMDELPEYFEYI